TPGTSDDEGHSTVGDRLPNRREQSSTAASRVGVRTMILAATRPGVIEVSEAVRFERSWKRHRAAHGPDVYGVIPPS
ncbi:MAG: hypothetical protein NDJ92_10880, partial [Thermoanaerobaculia bacterium]|nr:hypothetical protein [Thermoanaerobaculia bacterium]